MAGIIENDAKVKAIDVVPVRRGGSGLLEAASMVRDESSSSEKRAHDSISLQLNIWGLQVAFGTLGPIPQMLTVFPTQWGFE